MAINYDSITRKFFVPEEDDAGGTGLPFPGHTESIEGGAASTAEWPSPSDTVEYVNDLSPSLPHNRLETFMAMICGDTRVAPIRPITNLEKYYNMLAKKLEGSPYFPDTRKVVFHNKIRFDKITVTYEDADPLTESLYVSTVRTTIPIGAFNSKGAYRFDATINGFEFDGFALNGSDIISAAEDNKQYEDGAVYSENGTVPPELIIILPPERDGSIGKVALYNDEGTFFVGDIGIVVLSPNEDEATYSAQLAIHLAPNGETPPDHFDNVDVTIKLGLAGIIPPAPHSNPGGIMEGDPISIPSDGGDHQ